MARLFVAVELPHAISDELSAIGGGIRAARWLDVDQLHLTLSFLGNVRMDQQSRLVEQLARIDASPFNLRVADVGHFPPRGEPRVVWAGVSRPDALMALQKRVADVARALSLKVEGRKYHPHVTLARMKGCDDREVAQFLAEHAGTPWGEFTVSAISLWRSTLGPGGAEYDVLGRYPLV